MSRVTSLVVSFDHDTKRFSYDKDGTEAWIRDMFYPPTSTYCSRAGDHITDDHFIGEIVSDLKKILENQEEML
jgi:hypothetical protein